MQDLQGKAAKGFAWRGISTVVLFVLNIFITIILMRYILPSDYGIVAKLIIVLSFCNIFVNAGFSQAIVQQETFTKENLSSHFNLILGIGFFISCIVFILSQSIANGFNTPEMVFPLRILAISLFLSSSILVHRASLHRKLKFKSIAIIDFISIVVSGIVAIYLAVKQYGFMAIVCQMFVLSIIQVILYWSMSNFRPIWAYLKKKDILKTSSFSGFLFLSETFNYLSDLLDQFLISLKFEQSILGLYNRSMSLIRSPIKLIPSSFQVVLFPLFSRLQESEKTTLDINQIYYRTSGIIALLFLPPLMLFYFFATPIVLFVLGESWMELIPFAKIISLTGMLYIFNIESSIFLAHGKSKEWMYMNLFDKGLIILSIFIGIQFGLIPLLYALLVSEFISRIIHLIVVQKRFEMNIHQYIKSVGSSLLLTILFVGIIVIAEMNIDPSNGQMIIILALSYFAFILFNYFTRSNQAAKDLRTFTQLLR